MTMTLITAGLAGAAVVGIIVLAAVFGWGGQIGLVQRIGLCAAGAGLVGAGASRVLQGPVGWFDVLFLAGLALYLARTYGPAILKRADACDGAVDGHVRWPLGGRRDPGPIT